MTTDDGSPSALPPLCVLVHGFTSGPTVWKPLLDLAEEDPDRTGMPEFQTLDYWTQILSLRPDRMIPTIDSVADQLKTTLELASIERPVVLVGHSLGGLVVQRHLARQLRDHQLESLARIKRVALFACPNYGSAKLLRLRRFASRKNDQERELRPFNESVSETHRVVVRDFVSPPTIPRSYSIEWSVFYATQDTVVTAASARGGFPNTSSLDGDHSTVITPVSRETANYAAFRAAVAGALSYVTAVNTRGFEPAPGDLGASPTAQLRDLSVEPPTAGRDARAKHPQSGVPVSNAPVRLARAMQTKRPTTIPSPCRKAPPRIASP